MARDERLRKAYELGFNYEMKFGGCCQCTIAAIQDALQLQNDDIFKAGTAFAGGLGLMSDGICGALIGGAIVLSYRFGRERTNFSDPQRTRLHVYKLTEKLHNRFKKKYGGYTCKDVQKKLFGRSYNLRDAIELEEFLQAGGHKDKCTSTVGTTAKWTVDIILEEEKRELESCYQKSC